MLMSRNKSGQLDAAAEGSTRLMTVHAQKLAIEAFLDCTPIRLAGT